jgi:pimeloyl-ACP methyl ester carboxylesterase
VSFRSHFLMLCLQAASTRPSGNEPIERAIRVPKPPWSAVLTTSGVLATWLSNVKTLDREEVREKEVEFLLADGTHVGGLLFPESGEAPLVLATFGFLADRWSKPAAQFVDDVVTEGSLASHVLILDHPSSAPFLAANGELSIGGLDEGLMLLEVLRQLRGARGRELGLRISSYHLVGVSMGGLGVLYAIREDARRASRLISSAAVFSSVTRLDEVPTEELRTRGRVSLTPGRAFSLSPRGILGRGILEDLGRHFRSSYRDRTGGALPWRDEEVSQRLYDLMERRVRRLSVEGKEDLSFDSLNAYVTSSNLCDLGAEVAIPLVLIHAKDDPVVPLSHLRCLERSSSRNWNVSTYVTNNGGHWGFARTYGRVWIAAVLKETLSAAGR